MVKRKRGRKRKNGLYFGKEQEQAVIDFLNEKDSKVRDKIYNEHLRGAFNIMIESIIRRYKLYRKNYSFDNLHSDTLSYLILKADKYDPEKGNKAYSYYGTVCKNYIIGLMMKDTKITNQTMDFDSSMSTIHQNDKFIYHLPETDYTLSDLIDTICKEIENELKESYDNDKKKMTENERKVGEALLDILNNWEEIFTSLQGGAKFNKNIILATIRENTNLITKEIRVAMRRYKTIYEITKIDKIEKGYL